MDEVTELLQTDNPLDRIRLASERMDEHRAALARLGRIRTQTVRDLKAAGHGASELAGMLGVTRQQVYRLLRGEH